jgi:hypothetical protein
MTASGYLRTTVVFTAVCLAAPVALAQVPPEAFAFGKDALVNLPAGFEDAPGSGDILQVQSKERGTMRLSLELRDAGRARNSGEAAIRALAKQKRLQTRRSGKKLVLLEPRSEGQVDGRATRSMRMDIGFGRSMAVMTLTVFEDEKDAHRVRHFFEVELEEIIASIRRTGG